MVSTHSRPKAAASDTHTAFKKRWFQHTAARRRLPACRHFNWRCISVSTHSRPKAAAFITPNAAGCGHVSTHSRPKAAATQARDFGFFLQFQHTAARRRLQTVNGGFVQSLWFQHTAARRRLRNLAYDLGEDVAFQHTAARRRLHRVRRGQSLLRSFNTQPPEGGCQVALRCLPLDERFNTQPPEGGCLRNL